MPKEKEVLFTKENAILPAEGLKKKIARSTDAKDKASLQKRLADKEKEMIIKALKKYSGKRKKAADELGISERTLYRKIKEYSIEN